MSKPDPETQGADASASLTLRKPFNPHQLAQTVEDLLGRKANSGGREEKDNL